MQSSPHYSERQLKQAITWFVQLQDPSCSEQDRQRFQEWLAKNSAHQAAYSSAERLWGDFDNLKTLGEIPALKQARQTKPATSRALMLSLLLMTATFLSAGYLEYSAETLIYSTRVGEHQHLLLSDNSQLDLNTNTEVRVKISLLHRQIELQRGEALFTVRHESWRDFTVQANNLRIRDIGTRFNVQLKPDEVAVTVLEGEVELDDGKSVRHQSLLQGAQGDYAASSGLSLQESVTPEAVTAWLDGHLVFKRTPLKQVAAELERYHDVKFVFANPQLAQETLSGTFNAADLEPFLHTIKPMFSIQAKRQGKTILLRRI